MSPFARSAKGPPPTPEDEIDTTPKKLEWKLTPDLRAGIRFAETRISDLICQNDSQALEFKGYGGTFIKRHGFSPDAFVQMAFQAAYYGLYGEFHFLAGFFCPKRRIESSCEGPGRVESTYEPAMTKSFLHGRTEAIRTVQPESVAFVKVSHNNVHFSHLNVAHNAQNLDVLLRDCNTSREDCCSAQSM